MNADELTKEQVNEWSDEEVAYWFNKFSKDEQVAQMRKHMLDQVEIREAGDGPRVIKIDSTVVE